MATEIQKDHSIFYIKRGMGQYFYYDPVIDNKYKTVPSLLANQLIISLTSHESYVNQEETPHYSHPSGFAPQLQSAAMQNPLIGMTHLQRIQIKMRQT